MNRTLLLLVAATLAAAPPAHAHFVAGAGGTPKTYCENHVGDQHIHDYAINGVVGVAYILFPSQDGNTDDCNGDGFKADWDGHAEFAFGGAWLISSNTGGGIGPGGGWNCFGEGAHHPFYPTVWVFDQFYPDAQFIVAADANNLAGPDPSTGLDCGDGVDDIDTGYCVFSCQANFPPGLDGAYHVYVVNEVNLDPCSPSVYVDLDPIDACIGYEPGYPHLALAGHVITT